MNDKNTIEQQWLDARRMNEEINSLNQRIQAIEKNQKVLVSNRLNEQLDDLKSLGDKLTVIDNKTKELGHIAADNSLASLNSHLDDRMIGADLGIVKVYWIRRSDLQRKISDLSNESKAQRDLLEQRFNSIYSKLSDNAGSSMVSKSQSEKNAEGSE